VRLGQHSKGKKGTDGNSFFTSSPTPSPLIQPSTSTPASVPSLENEEISNGDGDAISVHASEPF